MKSELLIIFYRNPELGKVKTRLAATVGDAKALAIYYKLASHTRIITTEVDCDRVVYYSDYIDTEDAWPNKEYAKQLQLGNTLGDRMKNAFVWAFSKGYQRVSIIGTDCFELNQSILNKSFNALTHCDAVIGPAHDGGYYLLGMTKLFTEVFENKIWSSSSVYSDTQDDFRKHQIKFEVLDTLTDVDEERDLPPSGL
jgi:uncharacterized protein